MATSTPSAPKESKHRLSFLRRRHERTDASLDAAVSSVPQGSTGTPTESMGTHRPASRGSFDRDTADGESVVGDAASALPAYDALYGSLPGMDSGVGVRAPSLDGSAVFRPTLLLQLDTVGKSSDMAWGANAPPDPICVYLVESRDGTTPYREEPVMQSIRTTRGSNSCTLVAGGSYGRFTGDSLRGPPGGVCILGTTVYRVGPGRPPRTALFNQEPMALPDLRLPKGTTAWDDFKITNKSIFNRVQTFRSRLGTFEWRYATSAERKALSQELIEAASHSRRELAPTLKEAAKHHTVNNLMVLERVTQVYGSIDQKNGGSTSMVGKPRTVRRPVARLIRSPALRSPGSSRHSAGNGGRLQLDLREWMTASVPGDNKEPVARPDEKTHRNMMVAMAVSTCITMLKIEMDRRKDEELVAVVG